MVQGSNLSFNRVQHMAAEQWSYKKAHTSLPPLIMGKSNALLKELVSRNHAVLGSDCLLLFLMVPVNLVYNLSPYPQQGDIPCPYSKFWSEDRVVEAPGHDCHPHHSASAPHVSSCRWWPTGRQALLNIVS